MRVKRDSSVKSYSKELWGELNEERYQSKRVDVDARLGGLGPRLFVKVPRPEDSEVICSVFDSSCHLLLPV